MHIVIFVDRCNMPLGIEDKRLPSGAFFVSSQNNYAYGGERARINQMNTRGRSGGWYSQRNDKLQWLCIDLGRVTPVTGVATQGRYDGNQWVTTYLLSYSRNGIKYYPYSELGRVRVGGHRA
mgnify:CR=1 FL=1